MRLKSIKDQVVVLAGASSGIGAVTARQFAAKGAKVVVSARDEEGLRTVVDEIKQAGGDASLMVADVTDQEQVNALAQFALSTYGRIDTWVHLAGIGIASEWEKISTDQFRKLLDINVVGMFHGLKAAVPHMREAGGAFIGIGSVDSKMTFPLQSAYVASKHAVAGLLDSVRVELMHDKSPVSVTNIMPAAIDTPFFKREPTNLGVEANPPPPVYRPEDVARAVLYAAEYPVRELHVGGGGRLFRGLRTAAPSLVDRLIAATQYRPQISDRPKSAGATDGLEAGLGQYSADRGGFNGRFSLYTWCRTNPKLTITLAAAALGATAALIHEVAEAKREGETVADRLRRHLPDLEELAAYKDRAVGYATDYKDRAAAYADEYGTRASDAASEFGAKASHLAGDYKDRAADYTSDVRDQATEVIEQIIDKVRDWYRSR